MGIEFRVEYSVVDTMEPSAAAIIKIFLSVVNPDPSPLRDANGDEDP